MKYEYGKWNPQDQEKVDKERKENRKKILTLVLVAVVSYSLGKIDGEAYVLGKIFGN